MVKLLALASTFLLAVLAVNGSPAHRPKGGHCYVNSDCLSGDLCCGPFVHGVGVCQPGALLCLAE
ncbi:hypothetical protein C8J56DRAFT_1168258 [Mycena floridula]|nr:hypothetical protein C8J56DRAFT_1168258 [Mycena floridula]